MCAYRSWLVWFWVSFRLFFLSSSTILFDCWMVFVVVHFGRIHEVKMCKSAMEKVLSHVPESLRKIEAYTNVFDAYNQNQEITYILSSNHNLHLHFLYVHIYQLCALSELRFFFHFHFHLFFASFNCCWIFRSISNFRFRIWKSLFFSIFLLG